MLTMRVSSTARLAVARVAATLLIGVAGYWMFVFTQTDFRPQWRAWYLSAAVAFLSIGVGLWLKHRWAYLASVAMSLLGLAFTCFMLIGAPANAGLWGQALAFIGYIFTVAPLRSPPGSISKNHVLHG